MHKVGQKLVEDLYDESLLDVPCKNKGLSIKKGENVFTKKNTRFQEVC